MDITMELKYGGFDTCTVGWLPSPYLSKPGGGLREFLNILEGIYHGSMWPTILCVISHCSITSRQFLENAVYSPSPHR